MAALIPTYIPAPNWDIPADSNIVVLGRLIKDPNNPESRIPKNGVKSIPQSDVQSGEKTNWETTLEQLRSGKIGIWARCLQIVPLGGQLSFSKLKSAMEYHKFEILETKYFSPDDEYLEQALQDSYVQGYLEVNDWKKPVYMITGIKTARAASVTTESSKEVEVEAELTANISQTGGPVSAGPGANWTAKNKKGISYEGSTDYVFAYRLMRLRPKKGGTDYSNEDFVKGALFDKDERDDNVEESLRNAYDIDYYDQQGSGIADTLEDVET